jgi:hypothetical protein
MSWQRPRPRPLRRYTLTLAPGLALLLAAGLWLAGMYALFGWGAVLASAGVMVFVAAGAAIR